MAGHTNGTVGTTVPCETDADIDKGTTLGREPAVEAYRVNEGTEMDADVNRTALLGREPAERVCRVDEGDEMERKPQLQLQQTQFYCEENCQRNGNARGNVPSAHGLPLEGEWPACASGETTNPKGSENTSNAAVEHADGSCERSKLAEVDGVESRGCEKDTNERESVDEAVECCQQLCMVDGDGDREVEPADTLNKAETLVIMSIQSEE